MPHFITTTRTAAAWAAGLALSLTACLDFGEGEPAVEILQQVASPDGTKVATSFHCEGGGAAGYVFNNVAVTPVGSTFDPLDGLLGKHKTWNSFHDIQVKWVDDKNLEVSLRSVAAQPDAEQMSTRVEARHGVALHYTFQ
jgi:hypothetical protein